MVLTPTPSVASGVRNEAAPTSQVDEATVLSRPVSSGSGGMQGATIGIGDGAQRMQLLKDSEQASKSMFQRFWSTMSTAASGAGTVLWTIHDTVEQMNGLADIADDDAEESVDSNGQHGVDIKQPGVRGGHDASTVEGFLDESAEVDDDGVKFYDAIEADDDDVVFYDAIEADGDDVVSHDAIEADDDDVVFYDAIEADDDDNVVFYDAVEAHDEAFPGSVNSASRQLDLAITETDIGSTHDQAAIRAQASMSSVDDVGFFEVDLEGQEARDASESDIKAVQQSWGGWLVSTAASLAIGTGNLLVSALTSRASAQSDVPSSAGKAPIATFSEQNLTKATALANKVERSLQVLNQQLQALGAESVSGSIVAPDQINQPQLSTRDMLNRWYYKAQGSASAAVTTLGWVTAGTGVATVGTVLPFVPGGLMVGATAMLGGAFLGLTALRDYPELATNKAAIALISGEMPTILKDKAELDDILGQERARQTAMIRALMTTEARSPRIAALTGELSTVSALLTRIDAGEISAVPELRHEVALGDGKASGKIMAFARQARESFAAMFESIGRGLTTVGRTISSLPDVISRWSDAREARKAEAADTKEIASTLRALTIASADSQIKAGVDVRAMRSAEKNGASVGLSFVRNQCLMGENLTRTLLGQDEQAFGTVAYGADDKLVAVKASLTTARAMAWYLDAIASTDNGDSSGVPKVVRDADGSLSVVDPDRKLYSFLMNVPVAHLGTVAGDGMQSAAFFIDDNHRGMPQGMSGMQFESRRSQDGQTTLHLAFTSQRATPVFKPLGNESERLMKMYEAAHSAQSVKVTEGPDFTAWPKDRLLAHQTTLLAEITRENAMARDDQRQVEALKNWRNPAFLSGRA